MVESDVPNRIQCLTDLAFSLPTLAATSHSYFPTQALNFAFKDFFKSLFKVPKTAPYMKRE